MHVKVVISIVQSDLKGAYQKLKITENTQKINRHSGLYSYTRLIHGVSSAPGIFQFVMDSILAGLCNTTCYLDNFAYGFSLNEYYENVWTIFNRSQDFNMVKLI